jgi:hypothetical protein
VHGRRRTRHRAGAPRGPFDLVSERPVVQRASTGTATTSSPSIPLKSSGLHVYTGSACASAVAAIIATYDRAAVFHPDGRSESATRPKARAAEASNGATRRSRIRPAGNAPAARHAPDPTSRQAAHGRFGQRHRSDQRFSRRHRRIIQPAEHDHRARVEDAARVTHPSAHGDALQHAATVIAEFTDGDVDHNGSCHR